MPLPDHFQMVKIFESKRERSPSVVLKHNGQLGFSKGFDKLIGKQSKSREEKQNTSSSDICGKVEKWLSLLRKNRLTDLRFL